MRIGVHISEGAQTVEHVAQRYCRFPIHASVRDLTGCCPQQPDLVPLVLSLGGWTRDPLTLWLQFRVSYIIT